MTALILSKTTNKKSMTGVKIVTVENRFSNCGCQKENRLDSYRYSCFNRFLLFIDGKNKRKARKKARKKPKRTELNKYVNK